MDKKRYIIQFIVVLVLIVAVSSVPAVVAYMLRQSAPMDNTFVPAQVSAQVNVTSSTASVKVNNQDETQTTISTVTVTNTSNIDVYVRVRVVTYWQDSKDNVVARNSPSLKLQDGKEWKPKATQGKWIYDNNNQTFYYTEPIQPDHTTEGNLLDQIVTLTTQTQSETIRDGKTGKDIVIKYTYHPVVEFVVEAIQSSPTNAVKEKWNVTLDGNTIDGLETSTTQ